MPDMTASIPHQLTRAEAKRRIQEHVGVARQQHAAMLTSLQEDWTGDTMNFSLGAMGQSISGHLDVDESAVHITVALPWLLHAIVKPLIEQQGRRLLTQETK